MLLKNKTVIITGGSRGIGKAISIKFAEEGANLVINYVKNENKANETMKEIKKINKNIIIFKTDVSSRSQVQNMVSETIKKFGKIDVLVNNSGIVPSKDLIINIKDEDWDRAFKVNIYGCFFCTQIVANYMIENKIKGKIINISSVCGYIGCSRRGHYGATKGAIDAFTKACAVELAEYNINVNAVAPGATWTDMGKSLSDKKDIEKVIKRIPLKRIADPKDIAGTVLLLASEWSDYITGQIIRVDGGLSS